MQSLPHLTKRGNVYQWRRRSRRQSTGIVDIKLSLGTTDLRSALILSRKISAESDIVMEKLEDRQITAVEARKWLANVVHLERAKIERLQMLRRFDTKDPADDLRHDDAVRSVWQHIAKSGLNAKLPDDVPEHDLRKTNLEMIRADLTGDVRARIVARDFRVLTGREELSAMEIVALMNLMIEGKAAAWNRCEDALAPMATIADEMCQDDPGLMGAVADDPPTPVSIEVCPAPAAASYVQPDQPAHPPALPAPLSHSLADEPTLDPTISAIVQRMNEIKRSENIEEKTLRQYESFANLFTCLTGISDIRTLRQHQVKAFRADLSRMPKSWGKSPKDRNATRDQIMKRAQSLPADKVGLSVGTINRHLEHLGQIVEWALDEGLSLDPRLKPTKARLSDPVRDRDKKPAFTEEQLLKLFKSPVWQGSKSEHFQTRPGPNVYENGIYWCPLIGAYTGARREEIAGLGVSDIITVDGITCFSIEDSEIRRIKNISSKRIVPVHSRLIQLGFLSYVKRQASQGHTDIFPGLREPKSGAHGKKVGRRMRQIVDGVFGPSGARLSFQSLRHYVQNAMEDELGISDKVVRDIVGHEGKDVHEKTYSKHAPTERLREAINALPVVF